MSKNLRQRHMQYARNGSHISEFIYEALRRGNVLWRRFYPVQTELQAQQEEMLCQTVLDYPWNKDQNPRGTRYVFTRKSNGLFGGKVRLLCCAGSAVGRSTLFSLESSASICRWYELIRRSTCMCPMQDLVVVDARTGAARVYNV